MDVHLLSKISFDRRRDPGWSTSNFCLFDSGSKSTPSSTFLFTVLVLILCLDLDSPSTMVLDFRMALATFSFFCVMLAKFCASVISVNLWPLGARKKEVPRPW